jgi:class 3 adenylate cyclase/tetratricopeptide (TPR) repeat protein
MVALEAQRAVLGDAAVDTAVAALCEKLAALEPPSAAEQKRKQVTVLFADVSGFTAMSETMDAEEVSDLMNALWNGIDAAIVAHGGMIDKHIGDAVMALWGAQTTREDDPESAIRAALAMQSELAAFREEHDAQLGMRIGINTGPVLLGGVGTTGEFSAIGDTVNLASRLEHAAPVGGVLISHDTYRHVRGVFDVSPQVPLQVKGKAQPVLTYVVGRAKPRAFRMATRGVAGIETRMVGRDVELLALQNALRDAIEEAETHVVTVVGDAGVGKSRLLYEFENWVELLPDEITYFRGRATPETQAIAYGLLHNMLAHRFDIRESDDATTVLEKARAGMAGILGADRADLVGHLVGFDCSASPAVQALLGNPSFGRLATADLTHYLRALVSEPTVIFLEDIHWADDSSLEFLNHLLEAISSARLLVACLTRPTLFERRPNWGAGWDAHTRLDLKPLSRGDSRALVDEILQKVENIPEELCDLVVEGAEGNPFYVEELIKMLAEDGVILRGEERWWVELDRLGQVRVPSTLTGVLQARLDSLPPAEKALLQRASVVGRLFWGAALAELEADETDRLGESQIALLLNDVRGRELVFRRERSAFEGTDEYIFKHAVLRDVTYETVLLKLRRVYHAQVADWLAANAGERAGEYMSLMAGHYELAGEPAKAADCLKRSGEALYQVSAYRDAIPAFERALALTPPTSPSEAEGTEGGAERAALLVKMGDAHWRLADYPAAGENYEEALALARSAGDPGTEVGALRGLARAAREQGRFEEAEPYLEQGLALAREIRDRMGVAHTLYELSWLAYRRGNVKKMEGYAKDSLVICRELGDRQGIADALNSLGSAASLRRETELAKRYMKESLALCREIGDRRGASARLHNLGEQARHQEKYEEAVRYYQECQALCREIGDRLVLADSLAGLGFAHIGLGEYEAAWGCLRESMSQSSTIGAVFSTMWALIGVAALAAKTGRHAWAAELVGLVLGHPTVNEEDRQEAEPVLVTLREALPAEQLEAALERGKGLDLEAVVAEILEAAEG